MCFHHHWRPGGSTRKRSGWWAWGLVSTHRGYPRFRRFQISTDSKRIETPHRLFWNFGVDKTSTTHWSGGRVQVWVQVQAPACHLAITPEGYSRSYSNGSKAKSMAELLGPRSGTAWAQAMLTGGTRCGPQPARLKKKCYHSCDTDLSKFWTCLPVFGSLTLLVTENVVFCLQQSASNMGQNQNVSLGPKGVPHGAWGWLALRATPCSN